MAYSHQLASRASDPEEDRLRLYYSIDFTDTDTVPKVRPRVLYLIKFLYWIELKNVQAMDPDQVTVVMAFILLILYISTIMAADLFGWRWMTDFPEEETAPLPVYEAEPEDFPGPNEDRILGDTNPPAYEDVMNSV